MGTLVNGVSLKQLNLKFNVLLKVEDNLQDHWYNIHQLQHQNQELHIIVSLIIQLTIQLSVPQAIKLKDSTIFNVQNIISGFVFLTKKYIFQHLKKNSKILWEILRLILIKETYLTLLFNYLQFKFLQSYKKLNQKLIVWYN